MSNLPAVVGPPTPSEWTAIESQANALSRSNIVPVAFRGKPHEIIAAVITGRELGLGPMAAMRSIHVIDGKASLSSEAMLALVRRAGHSVTGATSKTKATAKGKRGDTGDEMAVEFTIEDAKNANLLNKSNWKSYPDQMLWARAVSKLCRELFSDVLLGMAYTVEELGDGEAGPVEEITDAELVEELPEGWADLDRCMAEHDNLAAALRDLPEDDPIRAEAKELKAAHGWPMPFAIFEQIAVQLGECEAEDDPELWDTVDPDGQPV